ncbi:MAG TPA: hypothetical protein VLH56_09115, partial [Dissulfurispiraceae bacterium]|nr:hypothetical protein [Dissulfurispiraceae bacterium]
MAARSAVGESGTEHRNRTAQKCKVTYAEKRSPQSLGYNTRWRWSMERIPRGRYTKEFRMEAAFIPRGKPRGILQ